MRHLAASLRPSGNCLRRRYATLESKLEKPLLSVEFDRLGRQLSINELSDWYKVTTLSLKRLQATGLLKQHGGSLATALVSAYPHHVWQFWLFAKAPQRYWKEPQHMRAFLVWAAAEMKLVSLDDWYSVSVQRLLSVCSTAGALSSRRKGNSLFEILSAAFPEHQWCWWRFDRVPTAAAASPQLQKQFLRHLAAKMSLPDLSTTNIDLVDWYKLRMDDIQMAGASTLLKEYRWSVSQLLITLYPHQPWLPWRFERVPPGWWEKPANRLHFFTWLASELNLPLPDAIPCPRDELVAAPDVWYRVDRNKVRQLGGATLLARCYGDSLPIALISVFPSWKWNVWKFPQAPKAALEGQPAAVTVRDWFETFAAPILRIDVHDLSSWYRVSEAQLRQVGARRCFTRFGLPGLSAALALAYPEHPWRQSLLSTGMTKKAAQRFLRAAVQALFPRHRLREEVSVLAPMHTAGHLLFDIVIPDLKLAFEYQGAQHYEDVSVAGQSKRQEQIDELKLAVCHREGLTLISIPHTLDLRDTVGLQRQIVEQRPDLAPQLVSS